ncbi:MAG: rhodanese-like domain-containing protein [bacterium]
MNNIAKKLLDLIAGTSAISYSEYEKARSGSGAVLIDVRSPAEFAESRLPEALNIPLDVLPNRYETLGKDKKIVTICAHGVRSAKAAKFLSAKGYKVESLAGGMAAVPDKSKIK